MKRKILTLLILLLLGLFLTYFFRYKTEPCICNAIPKDASAVLLMNTRNAEKYILHDILTHPFSYLGKENKVEQDTLTESELKLKDKSTSPITECIAIPGHILVYRLSTGDEEWRSSEIGIKDATKLFDLLRSNGFIENTLGETRVFQRSGQNIIINDDLLQFSYKPSGSITSNLASKNGEYLSEGDALFDAVGEEDSDILYADNEGQIIRVNFDAGEIIIDGQYAMDVLKSISHVSAEDDISNLSARLDFDQLDDILRMEWTEEFSNFTKLEIDSLQKYWDGSIHGSLQRFSASSDTITTYEYDDDFNKVEVKKVKEAVIPEFTFNLGIGQEGLSYLKREKAIVQQDGAEILAIMPLVTTYASIFDERMNFYSAKPELSLRPSNLKLKFFFDLQRFSTSSSDAFYALPDIFRSMEKVNMEIDSDDRIKAEITFSSDRNALISLIRGGKEL